MRVETGAQEKKRFPNSFAMQLNTQNYFRRDGGKIKSNKIKTNEKKLDPIRILWQQMLCATSKYLLTFTMTILFKYVSRLNDVMYGKKKEKILCCKMSFTAEHSTTENNVQNT